MNETKEKKTWCELLPSLYNLLVENADGIIDDTSLQRLLEWLKNVCRNDQQVQKLLECGTVEFMSKDHVFSNPESSAFFLSLFGFLVAKEEMFHYFKCGKDGDFVALFLDKPRTDSKLWKEGIVRNGYFQALSSLTEHRDGILWLRDTDHIECALDCLSDRSMFVATSARSLITKFLIKMSDWMVDQNIETAHGIGEIDDKCAVIVQRLKSMLNPETLTPTTSMAVIEVTRILLCENSMSAQKVLQDTKLFPECLNLMKTGNATVCQKLVDVICEMAKNSPGSLALSRLTTSEDTPWINASEILLGSCVDLFEKGLISTALELVAGLGSFQESSRDFPVHWLEVLFDILELSFDVIIKRTCKKSEESQNGYHANGNEESHTSIVEGLLSCEEQQQSSSKQQLCCILSDWIKESHSVTQAICQALVTAQQLTQQASSRHDFHVIHWLRLSLQIIQHCYNPTEESTRKLHGNQKVLKASLEFIASFAEIQRSKDILEGAEFSNVNQLFDDLVKGLLQLIESSETTSTVVSSAMKTLGKVLYAVKPGFLTDLFSSENGTLDETAKKRARLENSLASRDGERSSDMKRANREKLAFMLYRRLRDSSWEVRDSTLEFVGSLVLLDSPDSVHEFLYFHNIPVLVWNALNDSESYVRASAIYLIGSLACQSKLWTCLLQNSKVSEENILQKLSSILVEDDEAFPRRRAIECFSVLITNRHPITARILRSKRVAKDQSQTEGFPMSYEGQDLKLGNQSEATKIPPGFEFAPTVCHACQDFDWEVKLRGLEFWEAVIDYFTEFKANKERASTEKRKSFSGNHEGLQEENVEKCFQILFEMGALSVVSEALNDCDHMVCEKALEVLATLQRVVYHENSTKERCLKTSQDFQETLGKEFGLEKFIEVLLATDIPALVECCEAADNAIRSDPVSLIEDILSAAERHEENLLDCY